MSITKEAIKRRLMAKGYSTSPGLLSETIFAYVLDERERCAVIAESICQHPTIGKCEFGDAPALIAKMIRECK